jgi:hypothetical protein
VAGVRGLTGLSQGFPPEDLLYFLEAINQEVSVVLDVRFVDPGHPFPEPANPDAQYFDPSTREDFRNRLDILATQRDRKLFIARDNGNLVAAGVVKVRKVLSSRGAEVMISRSHARHKVRSGVEPLQVGQWYQFAIDPASSDILAAHKTKDLELPQPPNLLFAACQIEFSQLLKVSRPGARTLFSNVRRQPQIPFQFPGDGCWARAHEMVRLIERHFNYATQPVAAKIWNFGTLTVKTDNNPTCSVSWGYHVAPVVATDSGPLVIDPALFDRPVSIQKWQDKQLDRSAKLIVTSRRAYMAADSESFVEASPGRTERDLRVFRGELIAQIYTAGPLPYRCGSRQLCTRPEAARSELGA